MRIMESPGMAASEAKRELLQFLKLGLMTCGQVGAKERMADDPDVLPKVRRLLSRAYVGPIDGGGITADDASLSRAYDDMQKVRNAIVSPLWRQGPMNVNLILRVGVAAGSAVAVGAPKPLMNLTLANEVLTPRKSVAMVGITRECLRQGGARAESLINAALLDGEAAATNEAIATIVAPTTSLTVAGLPSNFIQVGLNAFTYTDASSRFLILVPPDVARILAGYQSVGAPGATVPAGGLVYPNMSVGGGQIGSMPVYVCEAGLSSGTALIVDANAFLVDPGVVAFDFSTEAALEFDDSPQQSFESAQNLVSLWQTNSAVVRCERSFALKETRDDAAVLVTGISLGGG